MSGMDGAVHAPVDWRLVLVESPFAGMGDNFLTQWADGKMNRAYLERCIRHCVDRGDSPYASHKMLTIALNDFIPAERFRGMQAGLAWSRAVDAVVVYIDRGVSGGMLFGIDRAIKEGRKVEYYSVHDEGQLLITRGALEAYRR